MGCYRQAASRAQLIENLTARIEGEKILNVLPRAYFKLAFELGARDRKMNSFRLIQKLGIGEKQIIKKQHGKCFNKNMYKLLRWEQKKKYQALPFEPRKRVKGITELNLQGWVRIDQVVIGMNEFQTKTWSAVWTDIYEHVWIGRWIWAEVAEQVWGADGHSWVQMWSVDGQEWIRIRNGGSRADKISVIL